ncbi:MAG: hypothetical protein AAF492_06395 [Verrucomicrobiota bacterium]
MTKTKHVLQEGSTLTLIVTASLIWLLVSIVLVRQAHYWADRWTWADEAEAVRDTGEKNF